jgi:hypothetical protein
MNGDNSHDEFRLEDLSSADLNAIRSVITPEVREWVEKMDASQQGAVEFDKNTSTLLDRLRNLPGLPPELRAAVEFALERQILTDRRLAAIENCVASMLVANLLTAQDFKSKAERLASKLALHQEAMIEMAKQFDEANDYTDLPDEPPRFEPKLTVVGSNRMPKSPA